MYFETKNLSVGYHKETLIKDINFGIERGQIITLIGPNGAGKSTILKTITNHLDKINGVITINQDDISQFHGKVLAKQMSVMLTERIAPELMTCGQLVAMGRYPYTNFFGKATPADEAIMMESLAMVKAVELKDRPFTDISDGQRQRVLLARAICQEPSILVLDEPTSYLDIRHKIELLDILRYLAEKKKVAIILSLHEIDLAQKISDYVICVKGDTIAAAGNPKEVFTDERIANLYDMKKGSFDSLFGSIELARPIGEPKVFVLAGGGLGIPVYRYLQNKRIPFSTGVLFDFDVDYQVANKLADPKEIVTIHGFHPITEEQITQAKKKIQSAEIFYDCKTPQGTLNDRNQELLQYARKIGKKVVSSFAQLECN